eukprot:499614_1
MIPIFEYISSLKNYDVSLFMDDWYQAKNNHLISEQVIEWITGKMQICDDASRCIYLQRHQRVRGKETYADNIEIDHKNILLRDQLDSIHTFIFHNMQHQNQHLLANNVEFSDIDDKSDEKDEITFEENKVENIWSNEPKSIQECNTEQLLWIIKNDIFNKLKTNVSDKLINYKMNIIEYVKTNKIDGNKLIQIKRKIFMSEIKNYLNIETNKLNGPLATLYTAITKYNISTLFENDAESDIWSNKPSHTSECNVDQLSDIFHYIISTKECKLSEYKDNIINYIKQNAIDGNKLIAMGRKRFINNVALYFSNLKLKAVLGKLYRNVIQFDLSVFIEKDTENGLEPNQETVSKFQTDVIADDSTAQYCSFGTQYRYTQNLKQHPLYVQPKYATFKDEMHEFFARINKENHARMLLQSQLQTIDSFIPILQPILIQFVTEENISNADHDVLWIDDETENTQNEQFTSIENKNCKHLQNIIKKLCTSLDDIEIEALYLNEMSDVDGNTNNKPLNDKKKKSTFIRFAKKIVIQKLRENRHKFIEYQQKQVMNTFIEKSYVKLKMNYVKQMKAMSYQRINEHHNIFPGEPLGQDHVLSLILWANHSTLASAFRETYKKSHLDETFQDQIERHSLFAHFGRLLYESFVFYGSRDSKVTELYHGLSKQLLFSTLFCTFNEPTPTTTAKSVATLSSTGIVMQLESSDSTKYIKTLDMDVFSDFQHEEQHLILETTLHIKDIYLSQQSQWIGNSLMNRFSLYDSLIHGNYIENLRLLKKKNQRLLFKMLQVTMRGSASTYTDSPYVNQLIQSLINKNKMWLNIHQIQKLMHHDLRHMFIDDLQAVGEFVVYLQKCFDARLHPIFFASWKMNSETFQLISRASSNSMNVVVKGPPIKCHLSRDKYITFGSTLTKIQDLFGLEIQLLDTYQNLPIKAHFTVQCSEANNFYTWLNPQFMSIEWNNTVHVPIPLSFVEEALHSISIEIAVFIHNIDEFAINIDDVGIVQANMTHFETSSKSYKLADCLSVFYGIPSSIMSVIVVISDIIFIAYLWHFNKVEEITKIINLLMILSIGNLVSVGIVICIYLTKQIETESFWKRNLLRFAFFILWPILTGFQRYIPQITNRNNDFIYVNPELDGMLIWFEQELINSKLVVIQSVFECCTQIIIHFIALIEIEKK